MKSYREEIKLNINQIIDLMNKSSDWKAMNQHFTHLLHKKSGVHLYTETAENTVCGALFNQEKLYVGYPQKDTMASVRVNSWRAIRQFNNLKKKLEIRKNATNYIHKLKSLRNVCNVVNNYEYHEIGISYQSTEYVDSILEEVKEMDPESIGLVLSNNGYHNTLGIWFKDKKVALMIAMKFS